MANASLSRNQQDKLDLANTLLSQGVAFFIPVNAGTKKRAWRGHGYKPIRAKTIELLLHQKKGKRYQYDLAIATGKWKMPERDQDKILIVFDVDNWEALSPRISGILDTNPTFTMKTQRGHHFYYWVPRWYQKSYNGLGCDWLGSHSMAVLTGSGRQVANNAPIATLSDADANTLQNYVKYSYRSQKSLETRFPRHTTSIIADPWLADPDYIPHEGQRNKYLNFRLFCLRDESEHTLRKTALEIADRCVPPYPHNEALHVVKSHLRNRHKFTSIPKKHKELPSHERLKDPVCTRLALCVPDPEQPFTRRDYEAALVKHGWFPNADGHIAVARQDIDHLIAIGEIEHIGQEKNPIRGRPAKLYKRTYDYTIDRDLMLPLTPTKTNIRMSIFVYHITGEWVEVIRDTMRRKLGLNSVRTISRYAKFLTDWRAWNFYPPLERQIQKPYISSWALNPKFKDVTEWPLPREEYYKLHQQFVIYRPTKYKRRPIQKSPENRSSKRQMLDWQRRLPSWWKYPTESATTYALTHEPYYKGTEIAINLELPPPTPYSHNNPHKIMAEYHREQRKRYQQGHITEETFIKTAGSRPRYHDLTPPPNGTPPVEVMEWYWNLREASYPKNVNYRYTEHEFREMFTPEQLAEWQAYHETLYIDVDRPCPTCGKAIQQTVKKNQPVRRMTPCEDCLNAAIAATQLPAIAELLIQQSTPEKATPRLLALYQQLFDKLPRSKREFGDAVQQFGAEWVEIAIYVTAKKGKSVRWPFPHIRGVLNNWQQQGFVNTTDRHDWFETKTDETRKHLPWCISEMQLISHRKNAFIAYHHHIGHLDRTQAYHVYQACRAYGDDIVKYAIKRAVLVNIRKWDYVHAIAKRLAKRYR